MKKHRGVDSVLAATTFMQRRIKLSRCLSQDAWAGSGARLSRTRYPGGREEPGLGSPELWLVACGFWRASRTQILRRHLKISIKINRVNFEDSCHARRVILTNKFVVNRTTCSRGTGAFWCLVSRLVCSSDGLPPP